MMRTQLLLIIFLMSTHAAAIAAVHTFTPTADTYVSESNPTVNDGQTIILRTSATAGARLQGYIKFNITGIAKPIVSVKLILESQDAIADASAYSVTGSWSEDGLTWENDDLVWGPLLDSATNIAKYAQQEFDITGSVTSNGTYTFGIKTESLADLDWYSREKTDKPPTLEITTATLDLLGTFGWQWLNTDCEENDFCFGADLDHNGTVNLHDFVLLGQYWLDTTGYYVATYGDDNNPGSFLEPFATITKAASLMTPGDTCYIRGGSYHEEAVIDNLDGTSGNPITFTNYNGETVMFDGTRAITDIGFTGWTQHSGNVYKTTLNQDTWQLFVDGEWMINARWPNANFDDESIWDHKRYWADATAGTGVIIDQPHDDINLAASGLNLTGALLIGGNEGNDMVPVTAHTPGTSEITCTAAAGSYYVENKLEFVDIQKEWFFDSATKDLYLWAPGGGAPTGDIRGKVQSFAIDFRNCEYINLRGINFFGTTANYYRNKYMILEDCNFLYPSCSKRMLGQTGPRDRMFFSQLNKSQLSYCSVINCTFENTDSEAIHMVGEGNLIENCLFKNIDYTGKPLENIGYTVYTKGWYNTFRNNTADTCGALFFLYPGEQPTIQWNRVDNACITGNDVGVFHLMIGSQPYCDISYNWVFASNGIGVRFDAPIPPTVWGDHGLVHHNVIVDTSRGVMIKGEYHETYNNTCYNSGSRDITILDEAGWVGNITRNNVADELTGHRSYYAPPSGTSDHDWNGYLETGKVVDLLRDAANLDFRPATGSVLIDTGVVVSGITDGYVGTDPDRGAYEYNDTNYWIPGRKLDKASTPIPPDGNMSVKTDADLMWLEGYEATSHDVYFGTNPGSLVFQGNQTNNIFDPGTLAADTIYYWRVDAVTPGGTITGDVWSLDTTILVAYPPEEVVLLADPANSSTSGYGGSVAATLNDPFAYDTEDPISTLPNQTFSGSTGFHGQEADGVDVILSYDVSGGLLTLDPDQAFYVDLYGRDGNRDRDDNIDVELYDNTTLVAIAFGQKIDGDSEHVRATLNPTAAFDRVVIVGHDTAGATSNSFTLMEIRAAKDAAGAGTLPPAFTIDPINEINATEGVSTSNRSVDSKESDYAPELVITYDVAEMPPT